MKKFIILLIAITTLFACSNSVDNGVPTTGTSDNANFIRGKVLDYNGYAVIAKVTLSNSDTIAIDSTNCNSYGAYSFEVHANGLYIITINYKEVVKTFSVNYTEGEDYTVEDAIYTEEDYKNMVTALLNNNTSTLSNSIITEAGTIKGALTSDESMFAYTGVADETVYLLGSTGDVIDSTVTDEKGIYQFDVSIDGDYMIAGNFQNRTDTASVTNYKADSPFGFVYLKYDKATSKTVVKLQGGTVIEPKKLAEFSYDTTWDFFYSGTNPKSYGITVSGISSSLFYVYDSTDADYYTDYWFSEGETLDFNGKTYLYHIESYENLTSSYLMIGLKGDKSMVILENAIDGKETEDELQKIYALMSGVTLLE